MKSQLLIWFVLGTIIACSGENNLLETKNTKASPEGQAVTSSSSAESEENNNEIASEPVMVAGAFLSCIPEDWKQGEGGMPWSCSLNGVEDIPADHEISGKFYSENDDDDLLPMEIIGFDRDSLTWSLRESVSSVSGSLIHSDITIGDTTFSVTYDKDESLELKLLPNIAFWYAGEPNRSTPDETCAEMWNNIVVAEVDARTPGSTPRPFGRLNDVPCTAIQNFLCRNVKDQEPLFLISEGTGQQQDWPDACPSGYQFSAPMTQDEMTQTAALIDDQIRTIWVALEDMDGDGMFAPIQ